MTFAAVSSEANLEASGLAGCDHGISALSRRKQERQTRCCHRIRLRRDGADALCAIREVGGVTIAQTLETAEQPAMPESPIASGCVDFVLTAGTSASADLALGGDGASAEGHPSRDVSGSHQIDSAPAGVACRVRRYNSPGRGGSLVFCGLPARLVDRI